MRTAVFIRTFDVSSKINYNWTKGVLMRSFDYGKLADKAWDNDILNLVAKIHEYKGRQDLFVRRKPKPAELDRLVEIAKYRVQKALIK